MDMFNDVESKSDKDSNDCTDAYYIDKFLPAFRNNIIEKNASITKQTWAAELLSIVININTQFEYVKNKILPLIQKNIALKTIYIDALRKISDITLFNKIVRQSENLCKNLIGKTCAPLKIQLGVLLTHLEEINKAIEN